MLNRTFLGVCLLLFVAGAFAYVTDGDTVYENSTNSYISATPGTLYGSGTVEVVLNNKPSQGSYNVFFSFNGDYIIPTQFEYWNPHNDTASINYFCNGTLSTVKSTKAFTCTNTNGTIIKNGTYTTTTGNNVTYTETTENNWSIVPGTRTLVNTTYDGKNRAYFWDNVNLPQNQNMRARVTLELPHLHLGKTQAEEYPDYDGKYGIGYIPQIYNHDIIGAANAGVLEYLDPLANLSNGTTGGWEFNNDGRSLDNLNNLTKTGGATISGTRFKLGNGSYNQTTPGLFYRNNSVNLVNNANSNFTICAWYNMSQNSSPMLLFDYDYTGSTGRGITLLWLGGTTPWRFALWGVANDFTQKSTTNTWHMICGVRNSTNYLLYFDGVNTQNKTLATTGIWNTTGMVRIGNDSSGNYWQGQIDSVMFFGNDALDPTDISTLYNNGTGREYPFTTINPCTYTSGNWIIQGSSVCNITTNTNVLNNNLTINGTGTTTITANVTNLTYVKITGGSYCRIKSGGSMRI